MDQRNLRKIIILGGVGFLVLLIIILLSQYTFLSVPSFDKNYDIQISQISSRDSKAITGKTSIVRTGTYKISIKDQDRETIKEQTFRPLSINKLSFTLNQQKKTYKVATDSQECLFGDLGDLKRGNAYSFNCSELGVASYNNFAELKQAQPSGQDHNMVKAQAYKSGVLGLEVPITDSVTPVYLKYIDKNNNEITRFDLGADFRGASEKDLFIDSLGGEIYVFNARTKKVIKIKNAENPNVEKETAVKAPDFDGSYSALRASNDGFLLVYSRGGEEDSDSKGALLRYTSNLEEKPTIRMPIDLIGGLPSISSLGDDKYAIDSPERRGVVIVRANNNKVEQDSFIDGGVSHYVIGGRLYVIDQYGGLYVYDNPSKELRLVYKPKVANVAKIYQFGDNQKVLVSYSKDSDQAKLGAYLLLDDPLSKSVRPDDYLPYVVDDNGSIVSTSDFVGNTIQTTVIAPVKSSGAQGPIYKQVRDYLSANDIDTKSFQIIEN